MREALADPAAYRELMPDAASLKARFGADVMAAEIEKAYFAALSKQASAARAVPKPPVVSRVS